MAAKKTNSKSPQSDGPKAIVVFWIVFVVVIVSVFLFNADTIKKNFDLFRTRLANPSETEGMIPEDELEEIVSQPERTVPEVVIIEPERRTPDTRTPALEPPTAQPAPTPAPTTSPTATQTPPAQTSTPTATPTAAPAAPPPPETRDRAIYYAKVNNDGQILQSKVTRKLPVSQTPMQDVLNAMLSGPTQDELKGNVLNLIPKNTRLLSATVRGSTAYLSFSEDFMFNTFGVEGYLAQLRQIVWTVTEFPNVRDVQILVEGRRVDYLAEGIWIGSPIDRNSF